MWRLVFLVVGVLTFALGEAKAEKRYALLIGNEAYHKDVGRLENPHEDVDRIKAALIKAGFTEDEITVLKDADQIEINKAVAQLARSLNAAGDEGVGFLYYSGHGGSAESGGVRANYLIPVGEPVLTVSDLPILGVPVDAMMNTLGLTDAKAIFIVIDACRVSLPITDTKGGAGAKGMVRVPKRAGMFVAFATADGATAQDDGLFSEVLASHLAKPYQDASRAFTLAMREVTNRRRSNELPTMIDGLSQDFCFVSCPVSARDMEDRDWQLLSSVGRPEALAAYLAQYPAGKYAERAHNALKDLAASNPLGALTGTKQSEEVKARERARQQYESGLKTDDVTMAVSLFQRACEGGEPLGCFELGNLFLTVAETPEDLQTSATLFNVACGQGVAKACTHLADMVLVGAGVEVDLAQGHALYERGCRGGDVVGCINMAVLYEQGAGVRRDVTKATELYSDACDFDTSYCTYLGVMYFNGTGVEQDVAHAMELYGQACEAGDTRGCTYLADAVIAISDDAELVAAAEALALEACRQGGEEACDWARARGLDLSN